VKRLAILVGLVASALVMIVLALRIPLAHRALTDAPVIGPFFDWLADLAHIHTPREPVDIVYTFDRPPSPARLTSARDRLGRLTGLRTVVRGTKLVVTAGPDDDPLRAIITPRREPIRVFLVVYQSAELDRLRTALRTDDQAKRLGITVELDRIGYHLHAPSEIMYVNPDWADAHHCTGHRIEGTGVGCLLTGRDRIAAYVRGDAGLFTDAHPDALAAPTGFSFYVEDDGDAYELESVPITIAPSQVTNIQVAGDAIDLALGPDAAAALSARATASDVEMVAELAPGHLLPVELAGSGHIAITTGSDAQRAADELALAALGLHQVH
jgi:hypothetical protein